MPQKELNLTHSSIIHIYDFFLIRHVHVTVYYFIGRTSRRTNYRNKSMSLLTNMLFEDDVAPLFITQITVRNNTMVVFFFMQIDQSE
jgi:hypothetical protein